MASTRKLENELSRIRREQDALLVLIVTPDYGFVAADPRLAPKDAAETLRNEIPLIQALLEAKKAGRS